MSFRTPSRVSSLNTPKTKSSIDLKGSKSPHINKTVVKSPSRNRSVENLVNSPNLKSKIQSSICVSSPLSSSSKSVSAGEVEDKLKCQLQELKTELDLMVESKAVLQKEKDEVDRELFGVQSKWNVAASKMEMIEGKFLMIVKAKDSMEKDKVKFELQLKEMKSALESQQLLESQNADLVKKLELYKKELEYLRGQLREVPCSEEAFDVKVGNGCDQSQVSMLVMLIAQLRSQLDLEVDYSNQKKQQYFILQEQKSDLELQLSEKQSEIVSLQKELVKQRKEFERQSVQGHEGESTKEYTQQLEKERDGLRLELEQMVKKERDQDLYMSGLEDAQKDFKSHLNMMKCALEALNSDVKKREEEKEALSVLLSSLLESRDLNSGMLEETHALLKVTETEVGELEERSGELESQLAQGKRELIEKEKMWSEAVCDVRDLQEELEKLNDEKRRYELECGWLRDKIGDQSKEIEKVSKMQNELVEMKERELKLVASVREMQMKAEKLECEALQMEHKNVNLELDVKEAKYEMQTECLSRKVVERSLESLQLEFECGSKRWRQQQEDQHLVIISLESAKKELSEKLNKKRMLVREMEKNREMFVEERRKMVVQFEDEKRNMIQVQAQTDNELSYMRTMQMSLKKSYEELESEKSQVFLCYIQFVLLALVLWNRLEAVWKVNCRQLESIGSMKKRNDELEVRCADLSGLQSVNWNERYCIGGVLSEMIGREQVNSEKIRNLENELDTFVKMNLNLEFECEDVKNRNKQLTLSLKSLRVDMDMLNEDRVVSSMKNVVYGSRLSDQGVMMSRMDEELEDSKRRMNELERVLVEKEVNLVKKDMEREECVKEWKEKLENLEKLKCDEDSMEWELKRIEWQVLAEKQDKELRATIKLLNAAQEENVLLRTTRNVDAGQKTSKMSVKRLINDRRMMSNEINRQKELLRTRDAALSATRIREERLQVVVEEQNVKIKSLGRHLAQRERDIIAERERLRIHFLRSSGMGMDNGSAPMVTPGRLSDFCVPQRQLSGNNKSNLVEGGVCEYGRQLNDRMKLQQMMLPMNGDVVKKEKDQMNAVALPLSLKDGGMKENVTLLTPLQQRSLNVVKERCPLSPALVNP